MLHYIVTRIQNWRGKGKTGLFQLLVLPVIWQMWGDKTKPVIPLFLIRKLRTGGGVKICRKKLIPQKLNATSQIYIEWDFIWTKAPPKVFRKNLPHLFHFHSFHTSFLSNRWDRLGNASVAENYLLLSEISLLYLSHFCIFLAVFTKSRLYLSLLTIKCIAKLLWGKTFLTKNGFCKK